MNAVELQTEIENIFAGLSGIHKLYDNVEYIGDADEWVRIVVREDKGKQITIGDDNPVFRYPGVLYVQIFVKPDTGIGRCSAIADQVTTLVRAKRFSEIQFFVPSLIPVGTLNGWYQVNVCVDYYRED